MRPDAIVFDLDGTLIDSAADLAATLNLLLQEHSRPQLSVESVRAMIGDGVGALVSRGFAATGQALDLPDHGAVTERFLELYIDPARDHLARPYPGVAEALAVFAEAGIVMGVCTNKAQVATDLVLRDAGLDRFFGAVVGQDSAPAPKPDPAHVRAVCTALGNPTCAVMVGDSLNDVRAGQAAGLSVILATYGYGTPAAIAAADGRIDRFDQLPAAIARLRRPGGP